MRKIHNINNDWNFSIDGKEKKVVNIPHTWNNIDGQDGGNDYLRTLATYEKKFESPSFDRNSEDVYLEFDGVNSECDVFLNDERIIRHEGGYSTFRKNITEVLKEGVNNLLVKVDNRPNDKVYPQKADFTFYGGIYRDVKLVVVNKKRFDLDYFGGKGLQVTATPIEGYKKAKVATKMWLNTDSGEVRVTIFDKEGNEVCQEMSHRSMDEGWSDMLIQDVHLWDGIEDPYLYRLKAELLVDGNVVDEVETRFGVRDFHYHPKTGFYLNGRKYTLHGVSRHQDRKGLGNAITDEMHKEDMDLICEVGANTIRLAHYQHSQTFYDLCDERGMVVWAEIPYISEHMPNARANTISQMKELIIQNYNHP